VGREPQPPGLTPMWASISYLLWLGRGIRSIFWVVPLFGLWFDMTFYTKGPHASKVGLLLCDRWQIVPYIK